MNQEQQLKEIPVDELKVGMYVQDVGRGWLYHPWLTKSKRITDAQDIEKLKEYGITRVVVDLARGDAAEPTAEPGQPVPPEGRTEPAAPEFKEPTGEIEKIERRKGSRADTRPDSVSIEKELPQARETYFEALSLIREFMADIEAERRVDIGEVYSMVDDIIDSVYRNRAAFATLLKLREYDDYIFAHPLNVTVLALTLGRQVGLQPSQLRELGLGTMFHDVGMASLPPKILINPGKLTEEEFELVKKHPVIGTKMMKEYPDIPSSSLRVILYHHERMDGSGYPKGLSGDQLDPFIIISGLADVFDACSSKRIYNKGVQPYQALRVIFKMRGTGFPNYWVDQFIFCMGIYPPGTGVQLNTGEIGVVTAINFSSLLRPRVKIVIDTNGFPLAKPRPIDLNDPSFLQREIIKPVPKQKLGIDPAGLIET